MEIKVEKNVQMPNKWGTFRKFLDDSVINAIASLEVGDSFTVKNYGQVNKIRHYAKLKHKKQLESRKEFTGKTVNDGFVYRMWCTKILNPTEHQSFLNSEKELKSKTKLKTQGMLSKKQVVNKDAITHINDVRAKIDNMVLQLAEINEENRMIVEDIDHIKKVLKEELGYTLEYKNNLKGV